MCADVTKDRDDIVDFSKLGDEVQQLLRESKEARNHSYSPYSKFKVGSMLLCKDGTRHTGCNVENASFPVAICAEQCAVVKAVSEGRQEFHAIGVVAAKIEDRLTTPCGVCRQMLNEFGDFPVYIADPELKDVLVTSTRKLLPYAFKKSSKENGLL